MRDTAVHRVSYVVQYDFALAVPDTQSADISSSEICSALAHQRSVLGGDQFPLVFISLDRGVLGEPVARWTRRKSPHRLPLYSLKCVPAQAAKKRKAYHGNLDPHNTATTPRHLNALVRVQRVRTLSSNLQNRWQALTVLEPLSRFSTTRATSITQVKQK